MGIDLMSVDRSSLQALGGKPRPANDSEVSAYMRWQRERRGLPDMQGMELEWSIYPGSRRQRLCIGATFGKLLASGGHNRDENGNYTYTAPQYENGAYSLVMPGHNAHKQTVTFESLEDAGNVERAQTLPMEPKKGGVIWTREDVRSAHGPVAKPGKAKAAPIEADPIPVQVEPVDVIQAAEPVEICAPAAAEGESAPVEAREGVESGEALSEAAKGFFVIDTAGLERAVAYHANYKAAMAARDLLEPEATYPGNRKTDGKIWRYMVTSETGPDDCRADLRAQTLRYHADIAGAATDQEPEAPEALCEAVSGQDEPVTIADKLPAPEAVKDSLTTDPVAALVARVEALEAIVATLSAETGRTPIPAVQDHPKRSVAHERAIRRAWAERKARRGAQGGMAIHARRIEALERELRLAQHEQELDKEALAEANSRAEHYYANWKEEARREGIQGGRRANSTLRARRMILAARQAAAFQRQRADVLAAQLDKLRADMADPIQPERASDIARLVRERDEARNAAAATSARNASLQAALNGLGDKLEEMAVKVTMAERAARVAPPIAV